MGFSFVSRVKFFFIAICLCCAFTVNAQQEYQVFVSPQGSDLNQGTIASPFKTLEKAKNFIRTIRDKSQKDITVFLRDGVYPLTQTLVFDKDDSGNKNTRITYSAYQNETPVLSGELSFNAWKKSTKDLWEMHIPKMQFRQLYINGKKAVRARMPNIGSYNVNLMWDVKQQEILIDSRLIKPWENFKNVELIVNMNWGEAIMRLESYTESNDEPYTWHTPTFAKVKVQNPERNLVFNRNYPPKKTDLAWYLENAFEFIDQPGEWYYDESKETLFYYPRENENIESTVATIPNLETLVQIKGTMDSPVYNLHFKGITFSHTTWLKPSNSGALNMQACNYSIEPTKANVQFVERVASAVKVVYANSCSFEDNTFTNLGASGLDLSDGTKNCLVNHNSFQSISANGIQIAKFSDPTSEIHQPYLPKDKRVITENHTISNNRISNIGTDYSGAVGIACGYGRNITISHNEIFDLPYSGISVGWGWTPEPNVMESNLIEGNLIYDVCKIMNDGGGIYTLSAQLGTIIRQNYIYNVKHSEFAGKSPNTGIYLDEGSKGILIENNVVENVEDKNPFILKGESVFKNNLGVPTAEVKQKAGILKKMKGD